jgi:hypothetical protein
MSRSALGLTQTRIIIIITAIGLTPGGSSTVRIYTQTEHRIKRTEHTQQLQKEKIGK